MIVIFAAVHLSQALNLWQILSKYCTYPFFLPQITLYYTHAFLIHFFVPANCRCLCRYRILLLAYCGNTA